MVHRRSSSFQSHAHDSRAAFFLLGVDCDLLLFPLQKKKIKEFKASEHSINEMLRGHLGSRSRVFRPCGLLLLYLALLTVPCSTNSTSDHSDTRIAGKSSGSLRDILKNHHTFQTLDRIFSLIRKSTCRRCGQSATKPPFLVITSLWRTAKLFAWAIKRAMSHVIDRSARSSTKLFTDMSCEIAKRPHRVFRAYG